MQKLSNLSGKHLSAYVAFMQEKGLAASTIKTDLAAIRFWHDQLPNARYQLPGNDAFTLERRCFGGVDRSWSETEFERLLELCKNAKHYDYLGCAKMARYAGLRIHECMRLDTAIARAALSFGVLTVKGKGGKVREIPLCKQARVTLKNSLRHTCAAEWYKSLIRQGFGDDYARLMVSKWLGHERLDVTRIYLAGIERGKGGE